MMMTFLVSDGPICGANRAVAQPERTMVRSQIFVQHISRFRRKFKISFAHISSWFWRTENSGKKKNHLFLQKLQNLICYENKSAYCHPKWAHTRQTWYCWKSKSIKVFMGKENQTLCQLFVFSLLSFGRTARFHKDFLSVSVCHPRLPNRAYSLSQLRNHHLRGMSSILQILNSSNFLQLPHQLLGTRIPRNLTMCRWS